MNIETLIKERKATIIDVRTREEFSSGNAEGSINIPLQEIQENLDKLLSFRQPLVLCCASGNRSNQACQYLSKVGFDCYNGGSWMSVNFYQSLNEKSC